MQKPELSIFLPGIRPFLWNRLYSSIMSAAPGLSFELVICGPFHPPKELQNVVNFRYIRDFGNVARAAQLAAIMCYGELITLGADDAVYTPGSLTRAVEAYRTIQADKKALSLRYNEGGNVMPEHYFWMKSWSHFRLPGVPDSAPMMLNSIMSRELYTSIGGYDCSVFNTCNWGGQDLTCRLVKAGTVIEPFREPVMSCDHTNKPMDGGVYGDHRPIDRVDDMGSPKSDYHRFVRLYSVESNRINTELSSWKAAEPVWSERFAEGSEK
jgi:hypothetical protein